MKCKLCLQEKKLVDSHLIPRAFFEYMRPASEKSEPFEIITNKLGEYNKKSRIGIYDNKILCLDCERKIQKYDDYGQRVLLQDKFDKEILDKNGKSIGWQIDNIDYKKIKLFFLSILWRCSVSEQTNRCSIGNKYEDIIKLMIINDDLLSDNFDCILSRHHDYFGKNYLLDPISKIRFKGSGINFTTIYLGAGYKLQIKVDNRELPEDNVLKSITVKSDGLLCIVKSKNFLDSKEYDVLRKLI